MPTMAPTKIDPTRHNSVVTLRMGNCHFDLYRDSLRSTGMNLPSYVTEISVPHSSDITGPPACIMYINNIILNKPTRKYPEIERHLDSIQQICNFLGMTHVAWDSEVSIEEWLHSYILL
jgi:hypothetical protein